MCAFKQISPSASFKSNNACASSNNDLALPHTFSIKKRSTNHYLQRSEQTETHVNRKKVGVHSSANKEKPPLYRKGQVVIYNDKVLCIKMIFKSTAGVWTYAVETEDGERRVIEEGHIEEPIQLGNDSMNPPFLHLV